MQATPSQRPLTALFLKLSENSGEAHVFAGAKNAPDALRFAASLRRFVKYADKLQTAGEFHFLVHAVYHSATVYLAGLVAKGDNRIASAAQFFGACFQCLDDCHVLLMRFYAANESDLHGALPPYLKRLSLYTARRFAHELRGAA